MKKQFVVALLAVGVMLVGSACQQQGLKRPKSSADLKSVHFDFDKSDIKAEAKGILEGNAGWMKNHKGTDVVVEGNCDERGTEEYNIALGHRRASSAKSYLVSLGVDSGRLSTVSYGEEKPAETCHNESCWWKNRRADFKKK